MTSSDVAAVQSAIDERKSAIAAAAFAANSSGPINDAAIVEEQEYLAPLLEGKRYFYRLTFYV